MSSYRISGLPALPPAFAQMKFRKALNAMSVHAVSRRWLRAEAGLAEREVDALLSLLEAAGVLRGPFPDAAKRAEAPHRDGAWHLLLQLLRGRFARRREQPQARPLPHPPTQDGGPGWLDDLAAPTLERIADDLHELLTRHPGARRVLSHLSVLESTLRHQDMKAAQALPVDVLRRALDQLRNIGFPDECTGLAILRSRLMLVVLRRGDDIAPVQRAFDVVEVGLSRFVEAQQQWAPHTRPQPG